MGVDYKFILMIGVKKDFRFITSFKNKNAYLEELEEDDDINNYQNIIYEDYLQDDYKVYNDGMCCKYSYIGKLLNKPAEYVDEIRDVELDSETLNKYIDEVYEELIALGIKIDKKDVKLHSFVYFS